MIRMSKHAQRRSQQRGVNSTLMQAILEFADIERPIGDNCLLLRVSQKAAASIEGPDKLTQFGVIWSETNARIVTVLPLNDRRYRTKH